LSFFIAYNFAAFIFLAIPSVSGASAEIAKEFQNLDYVLSCDVVGESSSW